MTDWATVSNLATASGTLVLAAATFSSIRSASRSAQAAERAVQAALRPLLISSRLEAPDQKLIWQDGHWTRLSGSAGYLHLEDGALYLAASLRNVGPGLGVIHGWRVGERPQYAEHTHPPVDDFHRQSRDLFIDTVVHAWDVAATIGEPVVFDQELLDAALPIAAAVPDGENRLAPSAAFHPGLDGGADGDGPALEQILSLLGRSPKWRG